MPTDRATGPCSSCCTRPGCAISEALGLDREDLSLDGGVRAGHRQGRSRAARAGGRGRARLARRWTWPAARPAGSRAAAHVAAGRAAARCSSATAGGGSRGSRPGPSVKRAAARRAWPAGQPAHPAPLVRDAPARGRRRPAHRPGVARTCEYQHDPAVHPRDRASASARSTLGPTRGPEGGERAMSYADTLLADGERIVASRAPALVRRSSGARRWAILAVIVARRSLLILAADLRPDGTSGVVRTLLGWIVARPASSAGSPCSSGRRCATGTRSTFTNRRVMQVEGVINKRRPTARSRRSTTPCSASRSSGGCSASATSTS